MEAETKRLEEERKKDKKQSIQNKIQVKFGEKSLNTNVEMLFVMHDSYLRKTMISFKGAVKSAQFINKVFKMLFLS